MLKAGRGGRSANKKKRGFYMAEYASKGVAGAGLGTGIAGLALGVLNGGLGNLLTGVNNGNCGCNEDHWVNRYEASQSARIAELETEVKLRDANTYTLSEMNKMRNYVDTRFSGIEAQLCAQNVTNAQITANLSCMQGNIATLMGLTKTIIPITNVCPEPMPQYNSWTAPTTTT
jgi:hypothetical protein